MKKSKASKKDEKETKHSSLIIRGVSIVAMTIMVSFIVFSFIIYTVVSQQSLTQQKEMTASDLTELDQRLSQIKGELQIANVVPSLTPTTRRALQGEPEISDDNHYRDAFNDNLFSFLSNPDITVVVYNKHDEIAFSNGNGPIPAYQKFKGDCQVKKVRQGNRDVLLTYKKVRYKRDGKLTGYIIIANRMSYYNGLMKKLLYWMSVVSVIAIVVFVAIAFIIVSNIVKPIKEMSKVAREVNDDPNSSIRIRDFHRSDELEELATSFNQMLDRMQGYIDQQKEFVGDVSHELRTPVAVIEGHLNMLERWGKNDPQILDESIKASLQETKRMQHLIQEMLDLTRAEQINVQYPNAVTNVTEVLKRVVGDLRLVHKDFEIGLDVDDLPPKTEIQIYQGHLEQLLVILIDNGIKYSTDRKQINISAGLSQRDVSIIVQDFGEGISQDEQDKIFNRFYRVDKARTREKGGNGLGLSIAKKLVTSYHGKISVDSVEGQGSQFKMVFPALSEKEAARLKERSGKTEQE
ncbi:ATP-binding protein [Lactobacillus sp. ESL0791]|uniref:HAMP domain-containing sensor histidine kinase n=1 Tax=Lactobacillus sp. ESL0791 TaxID=2983234 RepID=UPI0035AC03C9